MWHRGDVGAVVCCRFAVEVVSGNVEVRVCVYDIGGWAVDGYYSSAVV